MPLVQENFADLIEPGLRKVFADVFNKQESMLPVLFNMQSSDKAVEHDLEMGDIANLEPFEGTIPYDDSGEGYKTDYTHLEYARGIKVERRLVINDLYNIINKKPATLALAASRRREADGASIFNNAFNTTNTGGDALALCSSAHTSRVGGSNQSNTGTDAFTATAVETARQLMVAYKSNRDNVISVKPDLLIVPQQLEEKAYEIINSTGKVDTAQNNANFHKGKYKLVVWNNYLTDSNNWFLVDSNLMKLFLLWFDREPVQFFKDRDFDSLQAKFAAYAYYSYGFSDWRWVYGSNVA
jgi:hypothetical protein